MNPADQATPMLPRAELLERFAEVVGASHVLADETARVRFARSSGVHRVEPMAVVQPACTEHVQRLVQLAVAYGVPLYPISRGCNWGYGDACAPTAGQVIVDLSRMNRIVELNERLGYAVIEPGVSQGQLWQYLQAHAPSLWMDSTGAGPDASLVGNTLDRGFGHTRYGDHTLTACAMEIVLADGRLLNTGLGHYQRAAARHVYPHGVGPSLDGLFAQSNFGIVTRITLWLMRAPEACCAFFFSSPDEAALADLVERLAPLRMQGVLQSAIHIGNDLRLMSARMRYPWERARGATPLPADLRRELRAELGIDAWTGCGMITGTPETTRAAAAAVRRALRPYRVKFLNDRRLGVLERIARWRRRLSFLGRASATLETLTPLYALLKGEPTPEALHGVAWRVRGELPPQFASPLDVHAGIMWSSPVLPMTGDDARRLLELIEPIYESHGFEALVTFTMISERAMIAVTNLAFDTREQAESERAAACYRALSRTLREHGYVPYRVGPDGFDTLGQGSHVFWDVVRQLKRTLDPQHIISPGRYEPGP